MSKKNEGMESLLKDSSLRLGNDPIFSQGRVLCGIPPLDKIMGGGMPIGKSILIVGPESTGKTIILQKMVAAVQQRTERNVALLIDCENSYDPGWWAASGVDVDKLLVAQPASGEAARRVIDAMLTAENNDIGIIGVDSLAAMTPEAILENEKTMGALARLVGNLYQSVIAKNRSAIFVAINQVREAITGYEETYPGGKAQRYFSHIILRTRRDEWIKEAEKRVGFVMEITTKKNKTHPPQLSCTIPFRFVGQLDLLSSYMDEAQSRGIIVVKGPYYYYQGKNYLGRNNMRQLFIDAPPELEQMIAELERAEAEVA